MLTFDFEHVRRYISSASTFYRYFFQNDGIKMTEVENNIKLKAKLIDSTVFDSFKTLTSEVDAERLNGSLALLNHLNKNQQNEEKVT